MFETIQSLLLNPNIVFLLFLLAMMGLYAEIAHPGALFPGIVGSVALIVFLFAAFGLSPNWFGLIFMALAFLFLLLDLHVPTHGLLTISAVLLLIFGTFLFFQSVGPQATMQLQPWLVYCGGALVGGLGLLLLTYVLRIRRLPVTTGVEGMLGKEATAITSLRPLGRVRYGGENWEASLDSPERSLDEGTQVQIMSVDGLRLRVRPVEDTGESGQERTGF